jgi:hypothetical protein
VAAYAVFDIDGVLADVRHRLHALASRPKQWDLFFGLAPQDDVLVEGLELTRTAHSEGLTVVYSTGRPERCRHDTVTWLERHDFPTAPLRMRPDRDRRPARLTKLAVARQLHRDAGVHYLVDDDPAVVQTLRHDGFTVIHATWMQESPSEPEPTQQTLFDAQEQGRA